MQCGAKDSSCTSGKFADWDREELQEGVDDNLRNWRNMSSKDTGWEGEMNELDDILGRVVWR
jgi:hypothetical protein